MLAGLANTHWTKFLRCLEGKLKLTQQQRPIRGRNRRGRIRVRRRRGRTSATLKNVGLGEVQGGAGPPDLHSQALHLTQISLSCQPAGGAVTQTGRNFLRCLEGELKLTGAAEAVSGAGAAEAGSETGGTEAGTGTGAAGTGAAEAGS